MLRTLGGLLLIAHAVVTLAVWVTPPLPEAPLNPAHSWVLGDGRAIAVPASILLAVTLAATGIGLLLLGQPWWAPLGLVSGIAAAAFVMVYVNPWLSLAVAINAGIAVAASQHLPSA